MSNTVVKDSKLPVLRPATDIVEREDGFYVFMDMPGVSRQNLVIDLEDDELTIVGRSEIVGKGENYGEMQFGNGEYRQAVSLSDIVDREKVTAKLQDGVLEIHLPRMAAAEPRRIEISEG